MVTVTRERRSEAQVLPEVLSRLLPPSVCYELHTLMGKHIPIDEIRLRVGRASSVTSAGTNILLDCVLTRSQMDAIVDLICEGSLYAHADTINAGYVTVGEGVRVGIVGRASVIDGKMVGVYDVSSLCFRVPRRIKWIGEPVCDLIRRSDKNRGVLVFSPPGQGKTTLLREVSATLSTGADALRVVVIDSRGELGIFLDDERMSVDVLTGYPRALGIEIAARTMNAQLVVCDEIGGVGEAEAIIAAQNCGVPLLATAHANSLEGLLRRTPMRMLHEAGVFGAYVGIQRRAGMRDYAYTVTEV